jgi:hypothetical protein
MSNQTTHHERPEPMTATAPNSTPPQPVWTPPRQPVPNLADQYPDEYQAGQDTANRLIQDDPGWVPEVLQLVEEQLAGWPTSYTKNGLTVRQRARSQGFRDVLRRAVA